VTTTAPSAEALEHAIADLLRRRAASASICPSDVARALAPQEAAWRALMPAVRDAARVLAETRRIIITRRGAMVDPARLEGGPIRLQRGPRFDDDPAL
jgi:hypothetical protein